MAFPLHSSPIPRSFGLTAEAPLQNSLDQPCFNIVTAIKDGVAERKILGCRDIKDPFLLLYSKGCLFSTTHLRFPLPVLLILLRLLHSASTVHPQRHLGLNNFHRLEPFRHLPGRRSSCKNPSTTTVSINPSRVPSLILQIAESVLGR